MGNPAGPGPELRARLVLVELLPADLDRLLQYLLGIAGPAQKREQITVQPGRTTVVQPRELFLPLGHVGRGFVGRHLFRSGCQVAGGWSDGGKSVHSPYLYILIAREFLRGKFPGRPSVPVFGFTVPVA